MRQKYLMIRDDNENILKIREYAVIDKNLKNVATSNLREDNFFLLYEEIYDSSIIENVIASKEKLIQVLRTINFFPSVSYAVKIAEAVMNLYDSNDGCQAELFFDDAMPIV